MMAAMFSMRVVTTDHYLADPIPGLDVTRSEFRGTEVKKVPILRIFGSTPAGQKTCLHVHGVFPYLYVPYDGTEPWDRYLRQFATSLDTAINIASNVKSCPQHVYKLSLVTGIPMYGYHAKDKEFIKIYLYNPNNIKKAADLLLAGAVMSKPLQPYEAHIPYQLQLFIDFNLYGMNLINASAVKFRRKKDGGNCKGKQKHVSTSQSTLSSSTLGGTADSSVSNTLSLTNWDPDSIPEELYLPDTVPRQSSSELEVDIVAADILNRLEVGSNIGANPGLAALWEDEKQRRRDQGQDSQLTPLQSQDHDAVKSSESEINHLKRLREIIEEQKCYISSQSEKSDGDSSQGETTQSSFSATPASQVEVHQSQDTDSQPEVTTVVEEEPPLVSLESIHRVLSFSQSFSQPSPADETATDPLLTDVLASLAKESSLTSSQLTPSEISLLEDQDSVIADVVPDAELLEKDDEETLEMSQRVWDTGLGNEDGEMEVDEEKSPDVVTAAVYDVEGIDDTWDSPLEDKDDPTDDVIPQLDGASDEKPESTRPKKRVGVRGPVLPTQYTGSNYQTPQPYGREYSSDASYGAPPQDNVSIQPLGNPNPDYNHPWSQGTQNAPAQHSQPQFENWQHNAWQQAPGQTSGRMSHGNYQSYYNHPQSAEANYRYSSYTIHSPDSSGFVSSPPYDANTSSNFSSGQGMGVTAHDSFQQVMQIGSDNMGSQEYTNSDQYSSSSKQYSHLTRDPHSGRCSETTMDLGSSRHLMTDTEPFGQMVNTLSSPLQNPDMTTTVTDLDTLQTCISPTSSMSRSVDVSQQDLFTSPQDIGKGRSMSLDASSHSECLIDLSNCHGFMPSGYKSTSSDNLCTDINMSSSFLSSSLSENKEGNYSSSAMSGLFNLVSNISDSPIYEGTGKQGTGKHQSRLSLKRSRSCSATVSESQTDCTSGWRINSDSMSNIWNVSDLSTHTPDSGLPVFSDRMSEFQRGSRSNQTKSGKSKTKTRCRSKAVSSKPLPKDAAYTYSFHVPTPVFKRLKLHQKDVLDKIKVVRMHPKDARKYSLLKIGREVVEVQKLSPQDILKYCHSDLADSEPDAAVTDHESLTSPLDSPFGDLTENNKSVAKKLDVDSSESSLSSVSDNFSGRISVVTLKPEREFQASSVVSSLSSIAENNSLTTVEQTKESSTSVTAPPEGIIASLLLGTNVSLKEMPVKQSSNTSDRQIESHEKQVETTEHFQKYIKRTSASLEVAEKPTKLESIIEKKIETVVNPHQFSPETKKNTDSVAGKHVGISNKMPSNSSSFSAAFEQFVMAKKKELPENHKSEDSAQNIVGTNVGDRSGKIESAECLEDDVTISKTEKLYKSPVISERGNVIVRQREVNPSSHEEITQPDCQGGHCPVSPTKSDACQEDSLGSCNQRSAMCDSVQEDLFSDSYPNDGPCTTPHGCGQDDVSHDHSKDLPPLKPTHQNESDNTRDSFDNCSLKYPSQNGQSHSVLPALQFCDKINSSNSCIPKPESAAGNSEDITNCCISEFPCGKEDQDKGIEISYPEVKSSPKQESPHAGSSTQVCEGTPCVDLSEKTQGVCHPLDTSNLDQEQNDLTLGKYFISGDETSLKRSIQEEKIGTFSKDSSSSGDTVSGVFHHLTSKNYKINAEILESEREQLSEAESTTSNAQSGTSSRTSSRKESSDSNECVFEDIKQPFNKTQILQNVDPISECSDSNLELHDMYFDSYSSEIRRKRTAANYSPNAFSHLFKIGKPKETKEVCKQPMRQAATKHVTRLAIKHSTRQAAKQACKQATKGKRKKTTTSQKLIPGVHYIIVGKFKGYKSMRVTLRKLDMGINERVNVEEYLDKYSEEREFMRKATVKALQNLRTSSVSNDSHVLDDSSLSEKIEGYISEKIDNDSIQRSMKCFSDIQGNSFDSSSAMSSHSECDNRDLSLGITEMATDNALVCDSGSKSDIHPDSTYSDKETFNLDHHKSSNICENSNNEQSSFLETVTFDIDQSLDTTIDAAFGIKVDKNKLSLKKKPIPPADADRVELTTTIDKKIFPSSYQTAEKIEMFSKDVESDTALATGSTAFISGDHSEFFDSSNSNDSNSNFGQSFNNKTHEASAPSALGHANNGSKKKSVRKKLTRNQKLGVAFLSTRRKKKPNKEAGKLMSSLSLLHQATLQSLVDKSSDISSDACISSDPLQMSENVNGSDECCNMDISSGIVVPGDDSVHKDDSVDLFQTSNNSMRFSGFSRQAYTDKTDDYEVTFDDTMYKLALFSPPLSDQGEVSPPVPLSPIELAGDSPRIPQHSASTACKTVTTSPKLEKNRVPNSVESIYETPLSSVETQKDLNNLTDVKGVNHYSGNLHVSISSSESLSSTSDVSPLKKAAVSLSPMMLSDISNLSPPWKDKSSSQKCPDSVLCSNLKHDKRSDDPSWQVCDQNLLISKSVSQNKDTHQHIKDIKLIDNANRQNVDKHSVAECGFSYNSCTKLDSGANVSDNWLPLTICAQSEMDYDPFSNPIKDPQYDDISSDEDAEPTDGTKNKDKTSAVTKSSFSSKSILSIKSIEEDASDGDLPSSDIHLDASKTGEALSGGHTGKVVICPQVHPPTRQMVGLTAAANGLGSVQARKAFCSNPADLPANPRLLGGPQSKLQSVLVKDLPDFRSSTSETLLSWRQRFVTKNQIFSSQTNVEPLWEKLQKDPDFKYILSEDKHCVLAPCKPPPCKTGIENWLKNKQVLLKNFIKKQDNKTKTKGESDMKLDVCADKLNTSRQTTVSEKDISADVYDDSTLVDTSVDITDEKDQTAVQVVGDSKSRCTDSAVDTQRPCVQIIHIKGSLSSADLSTDSKKEVSPNDKNRNGKSRWDQTESRDSVETEHQSGKSSVLHSTPLRRKSSHVLFEPSCSPIGSDQKKQKHRTCDNPDVEQPPSKKDRPVPSTSRETSAPAPPTANRQASLQTSSAEAELKTPLKVSKKNSVSQIDGPTPKNTCGFKYPQHNMQSAKALHEYQYLTILSLELHVETRGDLRPDPEIDSIQVLFYSILNDVPPSEGERLVTGLIIVDKTSAQQQDTPRVLPGPCDPLSKTGGHSAAVPRDVGGHLSSKPPVLSESASQKPAGSSQKPAGSSHQPSTSSSPTAAPSAASCSRDDQKYIPTILQKSGVAEKNVCYVMSEEELIDTFIVLIAQWDPDILVGYEIQMLSWGYIIQRASQLGVNLYTKISRIPDCKESKRHQDNEYEWGAQHASEIHVTGRIVLNLWRLLRHEVTLNVYSFENVAFHVLHQRLPSYSFRNLSLWFGSRLHHNRWRVVEYYLTRAKANIEIIDQLDVVGKTSEFARVFGIEFFDVLSRGSQYRVESMMLRLAKPMNFIPVSPNVQQRARMKAGECIPLNLEPESRFYTDPVVVLDFQSLYPSIMIAYNYCFSTCLGRVECLANAQDGPFDFGCTSLDIKPSLLKKLENDVTVSPNGVVFVKQNIRCGIISKMVEEILTTRLMVKKSLKANKADKVLSRLLDARQLGLKLIANVTYGYTGASFSGRMPCIDVADSIVRKARESLELSIKLVEDTPHWKAKVVYGDTDSMFILLKGRSKDEAFVVGQEIADAVTNMFPKPMKLRFEKVYLPCVLQTKKRYVGFMYETPDQKEPVYDAKGIETVRRDTCAAVSKVLERSIKLLFTSRDVSQVKQYVQRQCNKLMEGRVSIQDCVFAKEYRGMTAYKPAACVPALEIARKLIRQDPRAEPRVSERVPYVIVYGSPGLPLIQLVRQPLELVRDPSLRVNAVYYITKQILPPLGRMFSLLGVDVFTWYQEIPRVIRFVPQSVVGADNKKGTISQYFLTTNCPICDDQSKQAICPKCIADGQMTAVTLMENSRHCARVLHRMGQVCYSCMGTQDASQPCISTDCPILYRRVLAQNDNSQAEYHRQMLEKALEF